jgi:glycine cleavage system H lipoate-binding protein
MSKVVAELKYSAEHEWVASDGGWACGDWNLRGCR